MERRLSSQFKFRKAGTRWYYYPSNSSGYSALWYTSWTSSSM